MSHHAKEGRRGKDDWLSPWSEYIPPLRVVTENASQGSTSKNGPHPVGHRYETMMGYSQLRSGGNRPEKRLGMKPMKRRLLSRHASEECWNPTKRTSWKRWSLRSIWEKEDKKRPVYEGPDEKGFLARGGAEKPLDFSKYQRSTRTGHQTFVFQNWRESRNFGIKTGWGRKTIVWLLAKEGWGTRSTLWVRKEKWPGAVERARIAPLLRPEARLIKNTLLRVGSSREHLSLKRTPSSKGGPARISETEENLHGGTKVRTVDRSKNISLNRW